MSQFCFGGGENKNATLASSQIAELIHNLPICVIYFSTDNTVKAGLHFLTGRATESLITTLKINFSTALELKPLGLP